MLDDDEPIRYYLFEDGESVRHHCGSQVFEDDGSCSSCGPMYCPDETHRVPMSYYTDWNCSFCNVDNETESLKRRVWELEKTVQELEKTAQELEKTIRELIDKLEQSKL